MDALTFTKAPRRHLCQLQRRRPAEVESFSFQNGEMTYPCFLRGTRLVIPRGPVTIEALRVGDEVTTLRWVPPG